MCAIEITCPVCEGCIRAKEVQGSLIACLHDVPGTRFHCPQSNARVSPSAVEGRWHEVLI